MPGSDVRLNRFIASCGICSRRAADKLIEEGRITINGRIASMGDQVSPEDEVRYDGNIITPASQDIFIMFNKPKGVTCTAAEDDPDNIIRYINYPERLFTIGRLDKDSTGLILLTNDGITANLLLRTEGSHEKEYVVAVDKPITEDFIRGMSKGVELRELDRVTLPCKVKKTGDRTFRITLTQGLNRQIRRMCEVFGYRVVRLKRIRFANIELGDLETGKTRPLTKDQTDGLRSLVQDQ